MSRHTTIACNGVELSSAVPLALIQQITEEAAEVDMGLSPRAGTFGQFINSMQRRSLTVHVDFVIKSLYDLAARASAQEAAAAWAQAGHITTNYRPGRWLRVQPAARPTLLAVRDYAQLIRATFTAYTVPYWQDITPTTVTLTGSDATGSITPPGTLERLPVAVTVTPTGGTLTGCTLTVGDTRMIFEDLSIPSGTPLTIGYDDDYILTISAGGAGQGSHRTQDSQDHLLAAPGRANSLRLQANVACSAVFSVRGLYL